MFRFASIHGRACFILMQYTIINIIKENIYILIHGHFHIGRVIIPRPPYWPETQSRANIGREMITRPILKCPCIKLFITYFRHLEKRHPYWPETKLRPILDRYGNDLVVIQYPVIFPGCGNMERLLPVILVIKKCLYLN